MIEILMPFYGDATLMRTAVKSVLNQDHPDWKLVVVDNHFPDPAPGQWVASMEDPRVTYVRNERNLGVSGNLQRCLEIASTSHFVIMGADDMMHANYVATIHRAISAHPDATMIQPRVRIIDENGTLARPLADRIKSRLTPGARGIHVLSGESLAASLLRGNWVYFPAMTWRRDGVACRAFRSDMETVFDLDFVMSAVIDGASLVLLEDEIFSYRRHVASVSSQTARDTARFEEESRLFAELAPRLRAMGWRTASRSARLHLTSRLHALALVPSAARLESRDTMRSLLRHALELP